MQTSMRWACLLLAVCSMVGGCNTPEVPPSMAVDANEISERIDTALKNPADQTKEPAAAPAISAFCGDCHRLPPPESFEREVWYEEIRKGYEFYARSGRTDLVPPPMSEVLNFYRLAAPEKLEFPPPDDVNQLWADRFEKKYLNWKDSVYTTPAISSISWLELLEEGVSNLIVSDMRDGSISLVDPDPAATSRKVIGRVGHPARVELCDLNEDGYRDLLVADLGSFNPYDHGLGQVVWLKRIPDTLDFEQVTLARGLGRVADVSVIDVGGDSRKDIAYAEFGHRQKGSISALINISDSPDKPKYELQKLDPRPGTIRLLADDWNDDGRKDLAAVISQEYETVALFLTQPPSPNRNVKHVPLWSAGNLSFGSIGIEPCDLDGDGDQDILYVNGDCFDNNFANRTHGIQWLENLSGGRFEYHRLADLPGAYRALGGDLDQDGDQDIVLVANLPHTIKPVQLRERQHEAVVVFEQTEMGVFEKRVLQVGTPRYPGLELGDFNGDGKLDFVTGTQLFGNDPPTSDAAKLPRLTVWWAR